MSLSNSSQSSSFDVVLSNGQDLTQVQVKMSLGGGGGPGVNFNANASITNIRIEVETDTTAPVISNVAAGGITASGATITWTTNENSDSQVEYGPTTAYGQSTTLDPALVTAHSQGLSGLTGGTLYHYRVKSRDAAGNLAVSGDFTFTTAPDTTPPTVTSFSPAAGATNVNVNSNVTVTFSEAMTVATVNGSTVELRDPSNALVSAAVSYNAASLTATLAPTASLAAGVTYTARVRGGGTDPRVKDVAGNALATDVTWTFTTGSGGIKWLVTDHLGSTRMVIDVTGSLAGIKRHDFAPFGEELFAGASIRSTSIGYGGDSVRQKFTGYERDDETGLDFAQARYHSSVQGRFTSVAPGPFIVADPQSWNRYSYVQNNPLKFIDPTGKTLILLGNDAEYIKEELERLTGFKLTRDLKTGVVTIDESSKRKAKGTSKALADRLQEVVDPRRPDVKINTVNSESDGSKVYFDSFDNRKLDVADYKVFKRDAPELAAAFLGHTLAEFSTAEWINGPPTDVNWLYDVSHSNGLELESKVLSDFTMLEER